MKMLSRFHSLLTLNQLSQDSFEARLRLTRFLIGIVVKRNLLITAENLELMRRDAESTAAVDEKAFVDWQHRVNMEI